MSRQRAFEAGTIRNLITWSVPEDDTSHLVFQAARVPLSFESTSNLFRTTRPVRSSDRDTDKTPTDPKLWSELTEAQKQRYPGDWERRKVRVRSHCIPKNISA